MLKCLIFISAIWTLGMFNDFKVQCGFLFLSDQKYVEGKAAEDLFIKDVAKRLQKIEELQTQVANAKANLSLIGTGRKFIPAGSSPIGFVWNGIKKWVRIAWDMVNISKRDYGQYNLKKAKEEYKKEKLLDNWNSGLTICKYAFKNDYFKKHKKWVLVDDHSKTKKKQKIWIKVQTVNQTPIKKPWRTSKRCMAKKENADDDKDKNDPFPVYIAAAIDFQKSPHKIFVFRSTPWEERNDYNKLFFWQHVVYVEAYLE